LAFGVLDADPNRVSASLAGRGDAGELEVGRSFETHLL
jgi:hypothetical protein